MSLTKILTFAFIGSSTFASFASAADINLTPNSGEIRINGTTVTCDGKVLGGRNIFSVDSTIIFEIAKSRRMGNCLADQLPDGSDRPFKVDLASGPSTTRVGEFRSAAKAGDALKEYYKAGACD